MSKCLIVLNLCYGVFNPLSTLSCYKPNIVAGSIIEVSKGFDFSFIANDQHTRDDIEMQLLPPHCIKDTIDCVRMFDYESQIKSKYKAVFNKKTFNALDNQFNKVNILSCGADEYCVSGFYGNWDIKETVRSLIGFDKKVILYKNCIGDVSKEAVDTSIKEMKELGIEII